MPLPATVKCMWILVKTLGSFSARSLVSLTLHRSKRGRHQVERCSVKLTSERAEKDPKVFTKIHMHFTVAGKGIPASAVERAIALSHETYCSASIMLAKTAEITTSFDLIET